MTKQKHAYVHGDISVLAKSLRKQLAVRSEAPTHVELLNMLARASGRQNYQDWLAHGPAQTTRDVVLRLPFDAAMAGPSAENAGRDGKRIHVHMDVEIVIPDSPIGVIRVNASLAPSLFSGNEHPERLLKPFVLPSLAEVLERSPEKVSVFGTILIDLDSSVSSDNKAELDNRKSFELSTTIQADHAARLISEASIAERMKKDFEHTKEAILEILSAPSPTATTQQQRTDMRRIADYLEEYLDAEGDMFMHNWNLEKLGYVSSILRDAAKSPRSVDIADWNLAKHGLYPAYPPRHWMRPIPPLET